MSIVQIVDKLIEGEVVSMEEDIKILEGWKILDMEEYFLVFNVRQNLHHRAF